MSTTAPSLPNTYKAAQIQVKGGDFKIIDVDLKLPGPGEVLVKVLACGVCHSDIIVKEEHMPVLDIIVKEEHMPVLPRIPGHEIVGDVVAVHETEKLWKVGQRVGSGWHGGHCNACRMCRRGEFITCENEKINGITIDGGYAEYAILRSEAIASIPEDMNPAEVAPLLCAGVTTFNSLRHMNVHPGDVVAVQGIGGLGHLAIQFATAMGMRVAALSSSGSKEKLARELGATEYVDGSKVDQAEALQKLGGAKVIICTAPSAKIIQGLINGLAVDGTLLILALAEDVPVPLEKLVVKRLSMRGWPAGTAADSEDTVAFSRLNNVKCRIEEYPLEKVEEAFQAMVSGKTRFRAVLVF